MSIDKESGTVVISSHSHRGGPRPGSLALSLLLHLVAASALLWFSDSGKTFAEPTLYEQMIEPHQDRIVWYHLQEIPKIFPESPSEPDRIRAERLNTDVIIHNAPDAAHDDRLVWRAPDRKAPDQKALAADMIAVERGADATSKPERPIEPKAASVETKSAPKPFVAPVAPPPAAAAQIRLVEAPPSPDIPKLAIPDTDVSALTAGGKVKYSRRFVPPPPAERTPLAETAGGNLPFDAPSLPGSGGASDINALIVNTLHAGPIDVAPPRQSAISAGPLAGNQSGGRSGTQIAGVTVIPRTSAVDTVEASSKSPIIGPLKRPIEPAIGSQPYVTTRIAPLEHTLSAPLPPSARTIPKSIEARFQGRVVYTILLPMKGLPGYAGDWIIWFAERPPVDGGGSAAPMRAPLPLRKPMQAGAAVAVPPGVVRLSASMKKDGKIDSVAVIGGAAGAEDAAVRDIETWEFLPAMRNREPVDIDLILEIPFGISPRAAPSARVPVLTDVDRSPSTQHN
jgi:hypothetical protein